MKHFYVHLGKDETKPAMLRSILAQMEYQYRICYYHDEKGVPFRTHLYVPEAHPDTGQGFCEREDEGHVFKVYIIYLIYKVYTSILTTFLFY